MDNKMSDLPHTVEDEGTHVSNHTPNRLMAASLASNNDALKVGMVIVSHLQSRFNQTERVRNASIRELGTEEIADGVYRVVLTVSF